ncbi:hypothetical protein [Deinococcus altitudinis]|uniref:hypothetical protein n=1 Tax=Deinococcus altitudinis TaxID=468914 RepID=UPI0038926391
MAGKASRPGDMLRRLASQSATVEQPVAEPTPEAVPQSLHEGNLTVQTTRLSVDLDDQQFEFLTVFAMRRKVSKVDVMRALMAEMAANPDLAEQVSRRLPKRKRKQ